MSLPSLFYPLQDLAQPRSQLTVVLIAAVCVHARIVPQHVPDFHPEIAVPNPNVAAAADLPLVLHAQRLATVESVSFLSFFSPLFLIIMHFVPFLSPFSSCVFVHCSFLYWDSFRVLACGCHLEFHSTGVLALPYKFLYFCAQC